MKSFFLGCALAVLGAFVGVPAEAQTAAPGKPLTRAEVTAELLRARAAGSSSTGARRKSSSPAAPRRARPTGHAGAPASAALDAAPAPPRLAPEAERLAATR